MRILFASLFVFALILAAAHEIHAMRTDELAEINVTCDNVDKKIAELKKEKGYNHMRVKDGVYTVYPPTVVYRLVTGGTVERVNKMTTNEWEAKLDDRLRGLRAFERQCESYRYKKD